MSNAVSRWSVLVRRRRRRRSVRVCLPGLLSLSVSPLLPLPLYFYIFLHYMPLVVRSVLFFSSHLFPPSPTDGGGVIQAVPMARPSYFLCHWRINNPRENEGVASFALLNPVPFIEKEQWCISSEHIFTPYLGRECDCLKAI